MTSLPRSMQAIIAREPGDAGVLTLAERPMPEPGAGEVLLRVLAAGVNRPDIMQRQGIAKPAPGITDVLGLEVCGEVVDCGPGVDRQLMGQRLMSLVPGGGYAPWCTAPVDQSFIVPGTLSEVEAAALPEGLFTVWHNLFELGRLAMGETVLIHGAAGGIGTLTIRMAHAAGATVIVTDNDESRFPELRAMGADATICWPTTDFTKACLEYTDGRGVDVVIDIVGGDYVRRNLAAMAFGGRHVSLSFMQGSAVNVELLTLMQRQVSLHSSTMRPQSHYEKTRMAQSIARHVMPLLKNGRIKPRIHAAFPLAQAVASHQMLESGKVFGKLVLIP
ncbi:NAD(P)H-quinone oxidoreductase [Cupriavidus neocaledonicus]|uniref:NADPH:quinone reductase or related Zn-dependent oxidoreductase n=2 Tax=Cupriavidus neocaledonicus TaxID=1040979 RepID=A0A375HUX8_9BURK|nr:NAD(P)H-quinone oxidoreductase [Cupriavidus neocaledonicus]SOZ39988.1 NADPH:quinone reductase or related Zn-dependent oxidoreductase [Cupriavidus neocaledonicus]SPD60674.1 NADPH:quinone reductase or related Zn-dependent oxidoreductase [Cupriavidus neocaledonicus]